MDYSSDPVTVLKAHLQRTVARWSSAFGQYEALKAQAEQAVVREEWASGERYSLLPFYFQRFPGRGRRLKEISASTLYYVYYGFDEQGRLRVRRFYQKHPPPSLGILLMPFFDPAMLKDLYSEAFSIYSEDLAEIIEYSAYSQIPLQVQRVFFQGLRVVFNVNFRLNGYTPYYSQKRNDPQGLYDWLGYNGRMQTAEQYLYEEDRLVQIRAYHELPGLAPHTDRQEFRYEDTGKLARIEQVDDAGQRRLVYQRRARGQTFQSICQDAIPRILAGIVERLRQEGIGEPLYCIELYYQQAAQHFPPAIFAFPESYRQELVRSGRLNRDAHVYIPVDPEAQIYLQLSDPAVLEACQVLEQEIQARQNWAAATRILRQIAAALTRTDWSGILNVTPDFVVYAIDPELEAESLEEILACSVSRGQIREWKKKGWL